MTSNKNQDKDFTILFHSLRTDLIAYLSGRLEYVKLDGIEKISKATTMLGFGLLAGLFALGVLSFGLVAVSLLLGNILGNPAVGFGIVALFWLVLLVIVVLNGTKIRNYFMNKMISVLYDGDEDEQQ